MLQTVSRPTGIDDAIKFVWRQPDTLLTTAEKRTLNAVLAEKTDVVASRYFSAPDPAQWVGTLKGLLEPTDDREESFLSYEEFHNFLKFGNTDKVSQFAKPLWDDGHRSCRSVASIKLKILEDRYGEDIRQCHSCRLRIDMDTRAQLLQATLPEPKMSTSPSGLVQTEQPRASHPHKLETYDVTVDVLAYIDSLPSTKKRFKTIDTFHVLVCSICVASCHKQSYDQTIAT
ncbi:TPA: hypothetical protein ACH3X3_005686 [Trebouxia sp. C0006]